MGSIAESASHQFTIRRRSALIAATTALLAVLSARVFAVLPSMKPAPAESDAEPRKRTEGGAL